MVATVIEYEAFPSEVLKVRAQESSVRRKKKRVSVDIDADISTDGAVARDPPITTDETPPTNTQATPPTSLPLNNHVNTLAYETNSDQVNTSNHVI